MSGDDDIAALYGGQGFDTDREDAATGFDPIPAGWYPVEVKKAEIKGTKAGNGKYLKIELGIIGERFTNRKLFTNINLVNPNEKAVEIGQRELAGLGQACGIPVLKKSAELWGKRLDARVKIGKARNGYEADNEVSAYAVLGTKSGAATTQVQEAPAAPARQAATTPAAAKPKGAMPWER